MQKLFRVLLFVSLSMFFIWYIPTLEASSDAFFVWIKTKIDVPYGADINDYKNDYEVKFFINGLESKDFYMDYPYGTTTFSVIDTKRLKDYVVKYRAYNSKYNASSVQEITFHIYDDEAPKINLLKNVVTLEYGATLENDFFEVTDNATKTENIITTIDDSLVSYSVLGTYPATVTAKDASNNTSSRNFTIKIVDTTKPIIQVLQKLVFTHGDEIVLGNYFKALDNYDGDITENIVLEGLDLTKIGEQKITVTLKDSSGNITEIEQMISILDLKAPTITLKTNQLSMNIKDYDLITKDFLIEQIDLMYDDFTSYDNLILSIDDSSLKQEVGDYEIIYTLEDEYQNYTTVNLKIKLREEEAPTIVAKDDYTYQKGASIDLLTLVTVIDPFDPLAYSRLEIVSSNLDTSKKGTYEVIYRVYNSSGLSETKTIYITIEDNIEETSFDIQTWLKEYSNYIFIGTSILFISGFLIYNQIKTKNKRKKEEKNS